MANTKPSLNRLYVITIYYLQTIYVDFVNKTYFKNKTL